MGAIPSRWSKRTFAAGQVVQWAAVQQAFEEHFMAVMPQLDIAENRTAMMLVMTGKPGRAATLFMALPEGQMTYEGFEPADFHDIGPKPVLLSGDQLGYEQLFGGPPGRGD